MQLRHGALTALVLATWTGADAARQGLPLAVRETHVQERNCSQTTPCQNWGTCDVFSGRCVCPPGYGGRLCENLVYPACRHTEKPGPNGEPPAMSCTFVGPQSCECFRQCDSQPEFIDHDMGRACFERDLPADQQLSHLPSEDEAGVTYYKNWRGEGAKQKMSRNKFMQDAHEPYLPQTMCESECFGNGYCRKQPWEAESTCYCHRGFNDTDCGKVDVNACMNLCSGHGKCLRGYCACDFGWFGIDCGYNLLTNMTKNEAFTAEVDVPGDGKSVDVDWTIALAAIKREPAFTRLRIYVHELPPWLNLASWGEELKDHTDRLEGGYGAWRSFLERLLTDWEIRTLDPEEANLFYVPSLSFTYTHNGGAPGRYVQRIVDFLKAEHPHIWERHQGRDHIFMALGDHGMCPLSSPEHRDYIWMTHFGIVFFKNAEPFISKERSLCFDPLGMVVLCPNLGNMRERAQQTWPELYPEAFVGKVPPAPPVRTTLFFFAGSLGETASRTAEYSLGVRQRIYRLFHNKNISGFVITRHVESVVESMRQSIFCLAPAGFGWGSRIVESIVAGCIPVIAQDGVFQPGHDVLPYDDFSVRVRYEDLGNLPGILGSFTQEEIHNLQANVKKWHRHFLWHEEGGFSYEVAVQSLRKKLYNLQARYGSE